MKQLIIILLGLIGVAYGQSQPTSAKTRFVNGIYLGTKLDSYFAAADSNAIYWRADSVVMAKYKGTARALAFAVSGGYIPYSDTTGLLSQVVRTFGTQTIGGNKTFSNNIVVGINTVGAGAGSQSVLLGNSSSASGTRSIAIGAETFADGTRNIAIGSGANAGNSSSANNVSVGANASASLSTGSGNVMVGHDAGRFFGASSPLQTPQNSVFIGASTKAATNTDDNTIVIGASTTGNGSNTVTIGNSSITNNYFTGNIRGGAFIKSGGTSSQFLKADGSVDGTSYATAASLSGYLPLSGGTLTGGLNGTTASFTGQISSVSNSTNAVVQAAKATGGSFPVFQLADQVAGTNWNIEFGRTVSTNLEFYNGGTRVSFTPAGGGIFTDALNGTSLSMSGGGSFLGNVGIGTASPSYKLDVQDDGSSIGSILANVGNSALSRWDIRNAGNPTTRRILAGYIGSTEAIRFDPLGGATSYIANGEFLINTTTTDGTNKLIVNGGVKANNVYLGTSSFLTSTSANIFQVGDRGVIENVVGNQMMVSNNAYYDGSNWKYISTAPASAIRFGSTVQGDISFHSAASGTAGTNITNWDGTDVKLYIAPSGAATFSSSVTATGATFDRTATGSNYLQIKALNSASNDIANWFTDGTNSVFAGMMRGTAGSSDAAFHVLTGGSIRFTVASTGAATFSSSVTANSFIKSGGTSSQALMADGSVQTVTSGTYNPTLTGVTNISSITLDDANFTRVGSVVNVYISGTVQTTAAGATSFTATLPINATGSTYIGFGNVNNGTADGTAGIVSAASTTTLTFDFNSINTTSRRFSISFQYSL